MAHCVLDRSSLTVSSLLVPASAGSLAYSSTMATTFWISFFVARSSRSSSAMGKAISATWLCSHRNSCRLTSFLPGNIALCGSFLPGNIALCGSFLPGNIALCGSFLDDTHGRPKEMSGPSQFTPESLPHNRNLDNRLVALIA